MIMCDIGFCVGKIIRGNEHEMALPCLEACNFNLRQVESVVREEKTKVKESFMFNEAMIKGKRKRD